MYWDSSASKFVTQNESYTDQIFWKFVSCFLVGGIGLPLCAYLLLDTVFRPYKYNTTEILAMVVQFSFAVLVLNIFHVLTYYHSDILFTNVILNFERKLSHQPSLCSTRRTFRFNSSLLKLPTGQFDYIGLCVLGLILVLCVVPFVLPWSVFYMKVDAVILVYSRLELTNSDSLFIFISLYGIRPVFCILCIVEGCIQFRTIPLQGVLTFSLFSSCLQSLITMKPTARSLIYWNRLRILFTIMDPIVSGFLTVVLAVLFYLVVLFTAATIVAKREFPWHIYLFVITFTVVIVVILAIIFYLLVKTSQESLELQLVWARALAGTAKSGLFDAKALQKRLRAMQHIRFAYGSVGTVTKETRTDYISSAANYTANCILALPHWF